MQASGVNAVLLSQWSSQLKHLANDIGAYNTDSLRMISNYLPDAKINSHIIDVLHQLNVQLSRGSDPQVYAQFKEIKNKFVKQLRERSAFIDRGNTDIKDIWTDQAKRMDRVAAEPLMIASSAFQDLRLMVEEVCEFHLEGSKQFALEDIAGFKSNLHKYINALDRDAKSKAALSTRLERDLVELVEATRSLDFDKAKKIIADMSS